MMKQLNIPEELALLIETAHSQGILTGSDQQVDYFAEGIQSLIKIDFNYDATGARLLSTRNLK